MSIAEFDVPPSWSLDERETRVTTKFPTGLKKHRETVTASLCLVAGRGRILKPPVNKKKNSLNQGNMISITRCCVFVNFKTFSRSSSDHCSLNRSNAVIKLIGINARRKNSSLSRKKKEQS